MVRIKDCFTRRDPKNSLFRKLAFQISTTSIFFIPTSSPPGKPAAQSARHRMGNRVREPASSTGSKSLVPVMVAADGNEGPDNPFDRNRKRSGQAKPEPPMQTNFRLPHSRRADHTASSRKLARSDPPKCRTAPDRQIRRGQTRLQFSCSDQVGLFAAISPPSASRAR